MTLVDGKFGSGDPWIPTGASIAPNGKFAVIEYVSFKRARISRTARMKLATGERSWFKGDVSMADYSPDGESLVFASEREKLDETCYDGFCRFEPKLYVMNVDGTHVRSVFKGRPAGNYYDPDWSPNGDRIVFSSDRETLGNWSAQELWSVSSDGSCLTRLTNGSPGSDAPAWGAGSVTRPGTCGEADLRPVVDVTYPRRAKRLRPVPMWLGTELDNRLLVETSINRNTLSSLYDDCSALDPDDCSPDISVTSAAVCERAFSQELIDGNYGGMERYKGGLVIHLDRRGAMSVGVSTYLISGRREIGLYSSRDRSSDRGLTNWHMRAIGSLRPVGANQPPKRFNSPVLAASTVRFARRLLSLYRKTGSLKRTAIKIGLFGGHGRWQVQFNYERQGAISWLRFARDLKRLGGIRTVRCGNRTTGADAFHP